MKYWEIEYEAAPPEILESLQTKRLQECVKYVYHNVPFYKKRMDDCHIKPGDIQSLKDIKHLPFTTKEDLRDNYPDKLFAVPRRDIVRFHASSGTTGRPTVVGYTREDLTLWSDMMARTLYAGGVNSADTVQIAYGYGLFTGGLGVHYGAERIGASVIPISGGNTQKQLLLMKDLKSTAIACTPSYAVFLAEKALEEGIDLKKLHLKSGFFGAEPWSEKMREQIEELWGIQAFDIYGLSEVIGPGVAFECSARSGLHVNEDHFYPEVIHPDTLDPLSDGSVGELVFTTITKKGIPIIRYRTKDLTSITHEICSCGRSLARMNKVMGRSDDMLIIRGVNVFPSQIEEALLSVEGAEPHYQIIVDRIKTLDTLEILIEMNEKFFSDEIKNLEKFQHSVRKAVESIIGISADIKLVAPQTLERFTGKAKRVLDKRKI